MKNKKKSSPGVAHFSFLIHLYFMNTWPKTISDVDFGEFRKAVVKF